MKAPIIILHPHFMKEGGASKVVLEFASRLAKSEPPIHIITQDAPHSVVARYPEIKFYLLKGPPTGSLSFWLKLPSFLKKVNLTIKEITPPNKPAILFCHSLAIYWGMFVKKHYPEARTVYYFHDLGLPYLDSSLERSGMPWHFRFIAILLTPIFNLIGKFTMKRGDYLVANSQTSANFVTTRYKREINLIAYPGVNSSVFRPTTKKQNYIYTLGRLEKIKQIDLMIQAFSEVYKKESNLEFKIIGEGSERANLQDLTQELGLTKAISFLGQQPEEKVAEIAAAAKIGLFLCENESFGLAAAESVCAGTPIVAASKGGVSEIAINGISGFKVENEPRKVAKKIQELYHHANYPEFCTKARAEAIDKFNWSHSADKLKVFFENLL